MGDRDRYYRVNCPAGRAFVTAPGLGDTNVVEYVRNDIAEAQKQRIKDLKAEVERLRAQHREQLISAVRDLQTALDAICSAGMTVLAMRDGGDDG